MSKCELIELKDLRVNDPIELAAPSIHEAPASVNLAPPTHYQVVRLVGDCVIFEAQAGHSCEGHDFQPDSYAHLAWCDLCGDFIWSLYRQSLRCSYCGYTCHSRCRPFIRLDCSVHKSGRTARSHSSVDSIETDTNVDEQIAFGIQELSAGEIKQRVKEYNTQINSNLYMVDNKDGTYTGYIKVHFQLARPITLPPPQSSGSTLDDDRPGKQMRRRTSFYLPQDAAKHLHISSKTRVREVIEALLNKFTVVDNPAKFALFERTERQGQVFMRKLFDDECPLFLRLCAGPSETVLSLVLKEKETGDVNWDAFSFPELCNFLRILQREEEVHVRQIVRRYALARERMKYAMTQITTPG